MPTTFLLFDSAGSNIDSDSAYSSDGFRTGGAVVDGVCPSATFNKALFQACMGVAALMQMMSAKGYTVSDGNPPAISPATALNNLAGVLANIITNADPPPPAPVTTILASITPTFTCPALSNASYRGSANTTNLTIDLYASSGHAGFVVTITRVDPTGNTLTITPNGSDVINGASTYTLTSQYASVTLQSDGLGNWTVIGKI